MTFNIKGLPELEKMLLIVGPREAAKIVKAAVVDVARDIKVDAQEHVPVKSGTFRRAIFARSRKTHKDQFRSVVGVSHGKGKKNDAFYWFMVEFGTVHSAPNPVMTRAYERGKMESEAKLPRFLARQITRAMARYRKRVSKAR